MYDYRMPYFLYFWLTTEQRLTHKCKLNEEQTREGLVRNLVDPKADVWSWEPPPPQWYVLMCAVCAMLFMVAHLWYQRFCHEQAKRNQWLSLIHI